MAITGPGLAVQIVDGTGSPLVDVANKARKVGVVTSTLSGVVKASSGQLYAYAFSNSQTSTAYFRLYDSATVTVGTTAVAWGPIAVPAGQTVTETFDFGIAFANGICVGATGSYLDSDTTTLTLAGTSYSIGYQ